MSTDSAAAALPLRPPLRRARECAVTGTAEGLAVHLGTRPAIVRALFVALSFAGGAGILLYAWFWMLVPWEERAADAPAASSRRVPVAWILVALSGAGFLVTCGMLVLGRGGDLSGASSVAASVAVALAVAAGLWATLVDRADPARGPRHEVAVRLAAIGVLTVVFVSQLALQRQGGIAAFALTVLPLAGIAVVSASTLVDRWRELSGERVRRIREEHRSEVAAHLHDSVLQTLALIQNRAGASSEVARLARAQERELRAWLYDGDAPADGDLATDLRDYAGALELDYPVRIDVVSAGTSTERASGEVAAAAREAMLNAARHAGGDVSVYIEGTPSSVDVYVRDRGPGFELAGIPGDRLGVRQSIVGRMRRAGGTASVHPGAGGTGTEVHLRFAPEHARRAEQGERHA